jgi:hypothetical protein
MCDVEVWKASLLHLPENEFFAIIRNYLGPVRTPFNKHRIIDRLVSFLKQKETIDRIITLLDERDIDVLIPLYFLEDARFDDLLVYFDQTVPFLELHRGLRNLEERLITFRDLNSDPPRLKINPILRDAVERLIQKSLQSTFSTPNTPAPAFSENPWTEDHLLAALFSLLNSFPDLFKADGNLRKKTEQEIAGRAPVLLEPTPYGKKIDLLLQAATSLELVELHGGTVSISFRHWEELSRLSPVNRQNLICAALIRACLEDRLGEIQLDHITLFLFHLLDTFPERTALSEETLTRLVKIQLLKAGIRIANAEEVTYLLLLLGIFARIGPDRVYPVSLHHERKAEHPLIVQANFTISIKPWLPLDKSLQVASLATIVQYNLFSTYEITKNSFLTALRRGLTADEAVTWLEDHSESPLPQNVVFSLEAWEREFTHIALFRGTVLSVSEEMQHFIEHTGFFETWVKRRLAAGLYLLDSQEEAKWMQAIRESGIEYIPDILSADRIGNETERKTEEQKPLYTELTEKTGPSAGGGSLWKLFNSMKKHPPEKSAGVPETPERLPENRDGRFSGHVHLLLDHLKHALLSSSLSSAMKEEYKARIENKLILYPEQLRPLEARKTHDEAKGLDYTGKVRLIEHALHNDNTLLEIVERTRAGKPRSFVIRPRSLDQSGGDLLLTGTAVPGEDDVAVRVGKISLIRKVRGSLFS